MSLLARGFTIQFEAVHALTHLPNSPESLLHGHEYTVTVEVAPGTDYLAERVSIARSLIADRLADRILNDVFGCPEATETPRLAANLYALLSWRFPVERLTLSDGVEWVTYGSPADPR